MRVPNLDIRFWDITKARTSQRRGLDQTAPPMKKSHSLGVVFAGGAMTCGGYRDSGLC